MTQHPTLRVALLCMRLLAASATQAQTMSKPDYKAGKTRISETYKTDKAECKKLSDNAEDICKEEAKGKEKVAQEKCDDFAGNAKNVCRQEAKSAEQKALADAKMGKDIGEAKKDAASENMDANYKVAHEKCDNLAGDTKASCVAAAKAKFGKN